MENGNIRRNVFFWGRVTLITLAVALALGLFAAKAEIVKSGACGTNLYYTLDDDSTLTISGIGDMIDFSADYYSGKPYTPWNASVEHVIIEEGVTSIGCNAFRNSYTLTDVVIPDSVNSIGNSAFSGCISLPSISISDNVTNVGIAAFESNTITYANPDSNGAIALSKAGFTFREIGQKYGLRYLFVDNEITGKEICDVDEDVTELVIPNGVTSIGRVASSGYIMLSSVVIPESITNISYAAFYWCSNLTHITIPNTVTHIGYDAFGECGNLSNIFIPESTTVFGNDTQGHELFDEGFGGTIYCHKFSDVDYWATDRGYNVVYVDDIDIESIRTLTLPGDFRLACGETRQLVADVFPNYDHPVVTWTSSAPEIASVEDGLVTAIAPGTAVITASLGEKTASVTVETFAPLQDFDMPAEVWVVAKKTLQLVPENVIPEGASGDFSWAMADTSIATVDETGLVSGRKPGDTTLNVTETGTGIARTTVVHVCYPVDAISLEPETASLIQGQSFQLTANVTTRTQVFVNKLVSFSSSDEAVATVDQDGVVTAVGIGSATITAAENEVSATCEVTVRAPIVTTLPANLTAIEAEAFMGDLSLESVVIPEGCASIGPRAFAGCANLVHVLIPAGTDVAADAFEGCDCVVIEYAH